MQWQCNTSAYQTILLDYSSTQNNPVNYKVQVQRSGESTSNITDLVYQWIQWTQTQAAALVVANNNISSVSFMYNG